MKDWKKAVAKLLVLVMAVSAALPLGGSVQVEAAKRPKLSAKSLSCTVGKTKTLRVKNVKKAKITWKVKSKKIAKLKKSGKFAVKVKGVKKGNTTITCKVKVKKKVYSLKCKVKVGNKKEATVKPAMSAVPTAATSAKPFASQMPSASPAATFSPVVYKQADFENGTDGFTGRFGAKVSVADNGYEGKCLYVSGRNQTWQGAGIDVAKTIVPGATYSVVAYIKHMGSQALEVKCSAQTGSSYPAIASVKSAKQGEWTRLEGNIKLPLTISDYVIYFEVPGSATADFYIDSVTITQIEAPLTPPVLPSMKDTYQNIFPYFGTCLNYNGYRAGAQLQSDEIMGFVQKHFNSFTLEDEMKPDNVLGSQVNKLSKAQASEKGYIIPDNYTEDSVPELNFTSIDRAMEIAYNKGMKMRAHVLMWHQQTPSWFFTKGYDGALTATEEVMDARLEFYVRTVMTHIMTKEKELTGGKVGSVVYTWDVVNEYLHRDNAPASKTWMTVYGDLGLEPTYVKKAYEYAYSELKKFGVENTVTLFYNDYDTYFEIEDLISLVNYINEGEEAKICSGIGMQSHVDVDRPTLAEYGAALDAFLATGLEIQITELDATINFEHENDFVYKDEGQTDETQAAFMKDFMELIVTKQKTRDKNVNPKGITGITFWGLYDTISWRGECSPLLFKEDIYFPKPSFYAVIDAAKVWN